MGSNYKNESKNANREAEMRREMLQSVESMAVTADVKFNQVRDVYAPVFRDLNPIGQLLPQLCNEFMENGLKMDAYENRNIISLPEEYSMFNSAETSTLLSILQDTNHSRTLRLLDKVHIRSMWREDRYYQIVDDPQLYSRCKSNNPPAFHNRVVLYLTTPGVLIYLKQTAALKLFSRFRSKGVLPRTLKIITRRENRQSKRNQSQSDFSAVLEYENRKKDEMTPFIHIDAFQYATYVHCYDGDILRFQLDFLAVKRNFAEALPILMDMRWQPNSPSLLLYRRKYYQYMTPFLDWVDMFRYQLKTAPTLSILGFYEKLLDVNSEQIDIDDLRLLGQSMVECIELRRLTRQNCPLPGLHGLYVGRRVYKDKDPINHGALVKAFGSNRVVRPVLHHACSPMRRFLFHLAYYDRLTMVTLPQLLALIEFMLHQEFFAMHPICRMSGIHCEPIVFQVFDFVWSIRQGHLKDKLFLRHESWQTIRQSEDCLAWYQRWDVFNCVCLLFNICQNAIDREMDEHMVNRLIRVLIDVLRESEFLESFVSYSYFDAYLGLNSAVNCVPNLSLNCYQRVLHAIPFHLCETLTATQVLDSFSERFWRSGSETLYNSAGCLMERPRTMRDISEFLIARKRRKSVRQAPTGDSSNDPGKSGMSALGFNGSVVVFIRDFNAMPFVNPDEEKSTFANDRTDTVRRAEEEAKHLAEFRQMETDYRYGYVFTDAYYMATGRPKIFYNENMKYSECKAMSKGAYQFH